MQHSAIHSSEETFLDTPTREKGQFTGDTVDISYATMIAAGDRAATAARDPRDRRLRRRTPGRRPPAATAPPRSCRARSRASARPGRVNAVYPNGDNMRDIPDYTEFVPEWVWRYYEQSGDASALGRQL